MISLCFTGPFWALSGIPNITYYHDSFFFSLFRYYHLKIFKVQILGGVSSQRQLRFERATRSLAMFIRSHNSLALQRSAALCFATLASLVCSIHRLAHLLRSLPRGTVEILEYVFPLLLHFTGSYAFFIFTRNTPLLRKNLKKNQNAQF